MNLKNLNKLIAPSALGFTTFGYSMYSLPGLGTVSLFGGDTNNFTNAVVGSFMDFGLNAGLLITATSFSAFVGVCCFDLYGIGKIISGKENNTRDELKKSCIIVGTGAFAAICGAQFVVGVPVILAAAVGAAFVGK